MRTNSLAVRLFLTATVWVVVILGITGVILSSAYRESAERAFDRRLNFYLRTLVTEVASAEDAQEREQQALGEPLFELPLSGWYWQIVRLDDPKKSTRASRSLWDKKLPQLEDEGLPLTTAGVRLAYVTGPEDMPLRMVERPVDLGSDGKYLISVAGDATEIFEETRSFDVYLAVTFAALAVVLVLSTIFQVRFGLAPLKRISQSLSDIRAGRVERLEGSFPIEIAPLARETNALLEANREIVERARTHVGNLAHALKTPLSVIVNEATARRDDPLAAKVLDQAAVMRDQVTHHLERARLAARLTVVGTVTDAGPVVEALQRTMQKIHRDCDIELDLREPVKFRGEQQDLEEMVGNLLDNACKWASGHVRIEIAAVSDTAPADRGRFRVVVDDDGPGLSAAERETVAKRGQRLDETKPGSGLGLSIVTDLVGLYGGHLSLSQSPSGGLRAELILPSA